MKAIKLSPPLSNYTIKNIIGKGSFADVYVANKEAIIAVFVPTFASGKATSYSERTIAEVKLLSNAGEVKIIHIGKFNKLEPLFFTDMYSLVIYISGDPGPQVAMKVMLQKPEMDYVTIAAQEIAMLKILNHPNIIKAGEFCFTRECIAFIMPHIGGGNLKRYIETNGPMYSEELKVRTVMRQLIDALWYLQNLKIVHNDIKPSNILIDNSDDPQRIKVCDFGLACTLIDGTLQMNCGSLSYKAPEKLLGRNYDSSADLYSAGILMYECFFGVVPFNCNVEYLSNIFKKNINIPYPDSFKMISEVGKHFLQNLLIFNKENRISFEDALKHPYISIEPTIDDRDFYILAKNEITRATELERNRNFGASYVCCQQAVISLAILASKTPTPEVIAYIKSKIQEYELYSTRLKNAITSLHLVSTSKKFSVFDEQAYLKLITASTKELAEGVELGFIGEMFHREGSYQSASNSLRDAVGKLLKALEKEPTGHRKTILGLKIRDWIDLAKRADDNNR